MRRRTAATHAAFFAPLLATGIKILDCGCGPGSITLDLARTVRPGQVIGIDFASEQFGPAIQTAVEEGLRASFQKADVYDLPFEQETFDAVFAHGLLSHLNEPHKGLLEVRRVLKRGGLVGLRDADWGGALVYPSDPVVDAALGQFLQAIKASGGNPEMGRRLGTLLREAGFGDVRMSASFEVYDPMIAARYLASFTGDHPIAPNLFLAQPWCEAVASRV
jgi:ubiquinone/menaquinone biosynthesis C-methylase UbiE